MGDSSYAFPNDLHPVWSVMIVLYLLRPDENGGAGRAKMVARG